MLRSSGSPSSSFLADQENRHTQSPSRRKNDVSKLKTSFSTPPNIIRSPQRGINGSATKVVTIFDHIVQWFHSEVISYRKQVAAAICAIFSTVLLVLTTSLLKLSIWAPFSSIQSSISWFLNPADWLLLSTHAIFAGLVSFFIISTVCKVDQQPRLSITDHFSWAAVGIEFVHRLFAVYFAFYLSEAQFFEGFSWIAISFATFISSATFLFRHDFQLTFLSIPVQNLKSLIEYAKHSASSQFFEQCGVDAAIPFTATIGFVLIFGPIIAGFETWWLLLSISFYFTLAAICVSHQFYAKMFMKIVNQVVMKRIEFPFPPPFTVHSPTPEQTRTLTAVIEIEEPMMKVFALYDLRTIAWTDESRRRQLFSLSQPGGHARNWKAVSSACIRLLDELCSKMTSSSARLVGYSWSDQNQDEDIPKEAILMPRKMREMAFGGGGTTRFQRNIAPIRTMNTQSVTVISKILNKVAGNESKSVISRFEAQLNSYAAEAIYMLVVDSLCEDRFGVVQKDLKELIGLICRLIASIDTYEKARASVADKSDVTYLRMVDSSLQSSLQRVVSTFGSHLKSLNLPEDQIRTIRLVCQIEEF